MLLAPVIRVGSTPWKLQLAISSVIFLRLKSEERCFQFVRSKACDGSATAKPALACRLAYHLASETLWGLGFIFQFGLDNWGQDGSF